MDDNPYLEYNNQSENSGFNPNAENTRGSYDDTHYQTNINGGATI